MRTALVIGLSSLALMGGLGPSEARFKLRLPTHSVQARAIAAPGAPARGQAVRVVAAAAAAPLAVRTAEALAPDEAGEIGFLRRSEPTPVVPAKKEAAPWCQNGRLIGSGAGFCIIN